MARTLVNTKDKVRTTAGPRKMPLVPMGYIDVAPSPNGTGVIAARDTGITSGGAGAFPGLSDTTAKDFLGGSGPTYKASEGGAETILPNVAKTIGNIPSSVRDIAKTAIAPVNPLDTKSPVNIGKNIVESAVAAKDIFSEQGAGEGIKNIASGFLDTAKKIFEAPGKAYMNYLEKTGYADNPDTKHLFETTILKPLEAVAKIGIEDPALIPSLLYGGGAAKGEDAISTLASPITRGADTSLSTVATGAANKADELFSGAISNLGSKIEKTKVGLQNKAVDSLESDYSKWMGETKPGVKTLGKTGSRTEALDKAGTTGNSPQRILAESKVIPNVEGTKFRTADQVKEFKKAIQPLEDANNEALKEVAQAVPPIKVDDLRRSTISTVESAPLRAGEKKSLLAEINSEYDLLAEKYPDGIRIDNLNAEKKIYGRDFVYDPNKPYKKNVDEYLRKTFQTKVEDTAAAAGFDDVAQLNREIGDRLTAADFLGKLDGQTINGGKLGKYVFMGIGASLGNGPTGKILGALGANVLGDILINVNVSSPVKRLILRSLKVNNPEAFKATLDWMEQQGLDRQVRLLLESPESPILINQGRPIPALNAGNNVDYVGKEDIIKSKPSS